MCKFFKIQTNILKYKLKFFSGNNPRHRACDRMRETSCHVDLFLQYLGT